MQNKLVAYLILGVFGLSSCEKSKCNFNPPEPPAFMLAGQSSGDFIFHHIALDTVYFQHPSYGTTRPVDLNNDGQADFEVHYYCAASPGHRSKNHTIVPLGMNEVACTDLQNLFTDTLRMNDTIAAQLAWANEESLLFESYWNAAGTSYANGLWAGQTGKYAALRYYINGQAYYGWLRLELFNYAWNMRLLEYAAIVPETD